MLITLEKLVGDFADGLAAVDAAKIAHKKFTPGIGPFGETDAVRAALRQMKDRYPERYATAATRRVPDLLIPQEWAIELKVIRPFGDNGKPAEHWSENVLHPYAGNTSSVGDCLKLLALRCAERKGVVIFGFEHTPPKVALDPAIDGFELLARTVAEIKLGPRVEEVRKGLIHPIHQQLRVFGFQVLGRTR